MKTTNLTLTSQNKIKEAVNSLGITTSKYNIALKGFSHCLLWNTKSDRLLLLDKSKAMYHLYGNVSGKIREDGVLNNQTITETTLMDIASHMHLGFLVNKQCSEINSEIEESNKERSDTTSMTIVITSTLGCNFSCSYCCQGVEKKFNSFSIESIKRIIEIWEASATDKLNLVWYGGEPLLNTKKIISSSTKIRDMVESKGCKYESEMLTNGYLLDFDKALSLIRSGINTFHISIDGSKEYHDGSRMLRNGAPTYTKIMDNIDKLNKHKGLNIRITVRINIIPDELLTSQIVNDLKSAGASNWGKTKFYLAPIEKRVGSDAKSELEFNDFDVFARMYKDFITLCKNNNIRYLLPGFSKGICTATKELSVVMNPDGELHKCWDTVTDSTEAVGNINSPIDEILGSLKKNHWTSFNPKSNEYCSKCRLLPACGGHCAIKHRDITAHPYHHSGCPILKFILADYLLEKAREKGIISQDLIIDFADSKIELPELRFS
tara:strand:- start:769 stop:2247 length:1479 start_codon:yes stop_codon:yes gene_type:complete